MLWWFFETGGHPPLTPAEGGWAGRELVLARPTPQGSAVHRLRVVGSELEYRIAVGAPGQEPSPVLGGRYARISTH